MLPAMTDDSREALVSTYTRLTREVLPRMAKNERQDWPVREDHCFQRIVLDTVCGGVWYDHLDRPAYRRAVALCHAIADGQADLQQLNHNSLVWRGKRRAD